jgi:hypothetical protein
MGGLVDSAAYVVSISVYQSSTLLLSTSRSNLTAPPGHGHAAMLLNLPSGITGKIEVDAELHDMFPGLSNDEALLARIHRSIELEVTPLSACAFTFSLQGTRCLQLDEWGALSLSLSLCMCVIHHVTLVLKRCIHRHKQRERERPNTCRCSCTHAHVHRERQSR